MENRIFCEEGVSGMLQKSYLKYELRDTFGESRNQLFSLAI
jgi:hypothetical protein